MKEVVGCILIVQAILTGIIVYSIQQLSNSIKESAAYTVSKEGQLSWGSDFPLIVLFLLILVIGIGVFLINRKK